MSSPSDDTFPLHAQRVKLVIGAVGSDGGDVSAANPLPTTAGASAAGGLSTKRTLDLGVTAWSVKTTPGQLYGYYIANRSAVEVFVKIYDAVTPTQADTPKMTFPIPAYGVAHRSQTVGLEFAVAIAMRATTALADNSVAAPSTNDVVANAEYK